MAKIDPELQAELGYHGPKARDHDWAAKMRLTEWAVEVDAECALRRAQRLLERARALNS